MARSTSAGFPFTIRQIENQIGSAASQANLVAKNRFPSILSNHIGMRFKNGYYLILGINALTPQHTTFSFDLLPFL